MFVIGDVAFSCVRTRLRYFGSANLEMRPFKELMLYTFWWRGWGSAAHHNMFIIPFRSSQ